MSSMKGSELNVAQLLLPWLTSITAHAKGERGTHRKKCTWSMKASRRPRCETLHSLALGQASSEMMMRRKEKEKNAL
jgi:hypothetical protein